MSEKRFPIQNGPSLPWDMIAPFESQAQSNHSQSIARLAQRGGLSMCEAIAVLECRPWKKMDPYDGVASPNALARLQELVSKYVADDRDALKARVADSERAVSKLAGQLKAKTAQVELLVSILGDAERAARLAGARLRTCEIESPDVDSRYTGLLNSIKEAGLTWDKAGILFSKDNS